MTNISSVVDTDRMLGIIKRRCDDYGVSVRFDPYAETASTNGHEITLPAINQPVTQAAMDKLYGFIIHECGHHTRSEVFDILKLAKPPEYLGALFNIIEDNAMERATARIWRGDHTALSNANAIIIDECAHVWRDMFVNPPVPWEENDNGPFASLLLQQVARTEWDTQGEVTLAGIIRDMPTAPRKLLDTLMDEGWHTKMQATSTVRSTWDLACDLARRLYPDRDDEITECESAVNTGVPREGTGDGTGSAPATATAGEGEGGEKAPIEQGYNISWKDAVLSEHDGFEETNPDDPHGGVGITWEDYAGGSVQLMPPSEINIVDLSNAKEERRNHWGGVGAPSSFMVQDQEARALGNQIRRYIQSRARSQISRHKRHGRLDKASLVKLALPPIDGGEYNRKIFYDQEKRSVVDTAVSILVDWSGSMHGTKMTLAADAAGRLATVLNKQIGIPVEILAFTTGKTRCDVGVLKEFKERGLPPEEIARRFSAFYKYSSGNNDADALMVAYRRLLRRNESRRVLIVLSDGAPTDAWGYGHADANLLHVVKHIQGDRRQKIELWGLGICSESVQRYYKLNEVIWDPHDINTKLFAIVKHGYEDWRTAR